MAWVVALVDIVDYIINNWERVGIIILAFIILGLTGNITKLIRGAKDGLKEFFTPLGFVVLCIIILLIAYLIKDMRATLQVALLIQNIGVDFNVKVV